MTEILTRTQIQKWDTDQDGVLNKDETENFFEDQGADVAVVDEGDGSFTISWGDGDEEFSVTSSTGSGDETGISAGFLIARIEYEAFEPNVSDEWDGQLDFVEFDAVFGEDEDVFNRDALTTFENGGHGFGSRVHAYLDSPNSDLSILGAIAFLEDNPGNLNMAHRESLYSKITGLRGDERARLYALSGAPSNTRIAQELMEIRDSSPNPIWEAGNEIYDYFASKPEGDLFSGTPEELSAWLFGLGLPEDTPEDQVNEMANLIFKKDDESFRTYGDVMDNISKLTVNRSDNVIPWGRFVVADGVTTAGGETGVRRGFYAALGPREGDQTDQVTANSFNRYLNHTPGEESASDANDGHAFLSRREIEAAFEGLDLGEVTVTRAPDGQSYHIMLKNGDTITVKGGSAGDPNYLDGEDIMFALNEYLEKHSNGNGNNIITADEKAFLNMPNENAAIGTAATFDAYLSDDFLGASEIEQGFKDLGISNVPVAKSGGVQTYEITLPNDAVITIDGNSQGSGWLTGEDIIHALEQYLFAEDSNYTINGSLDAADIAALGGVETTEAEGAGAPSEENGGDFPTSASEYLGGQNSDFSFMGALTFLDAHPTEHLNFDHRKTLYDKIQSEEELTAEERERLDALHAPKNSGIARELREIRDGRLSAPMEDDDETGTTEVESEGDTTVGEDTDGEADTTEVGATETAISVALGGLDETPTVFDIRTAITDAGILGDTILPTKSVVDILVASGASEALAADFASKIGDGITVNGLLLGMDRLASGDDAGNDDRINWDFYSFDGGDSISAGAVNIFMDTTNFELSIDTISVDDGEAGSYFPDEIIPRDNAINMIKELIPGSDDDDDQMQLATDLYNKLLHEENGGIKAGDLEKQLKAIVESYMPTNAGDESEANNLPVDAANAFVDNDDLELIRDNDGFAVRSKGEASTAEEELMNWLGDKEGATLSDLQTAVNDNENISNLIPSEDSLRRLLTVMGFNMDQANALIEDDTFKTYTVGQIVDKVVDFETGDNNNAGDKDNILKEPEADAFVMLHTQNGQNDQTVSDFIQEIDEGTTIEGIMAMDNYVEVKNLAVNNDDDLRALLGTVGITEVPPGLLDLYRGMTIEAILMALEDVDDDISTTDNVVGRIDADELIQLGIDSITDISQIDEAFVGDTTLDVDNVTAIILAVSDVKDRAAANDLAMAIIAANNGDNISPVVLGRVLRNLDNSEEGGQQNNGMLTTPGNFLSTSSDSGLTSAADDAIQKGINEVDVADQERQLAISIFDQEVAENGGFNRIDTSDDRNVVENYLKAIGFPAQAAEAFKFLLRDFANPFIGNGSLILTFGEIRKFVEDLKKANPNGENDVLEDEEIALIYDPTNLDLSSSFGLNIPHVADFLDGDSENNPFVGMEDDAGDAEAGGGAATGGAGDDPTATADETSGADSAGSPAIEAFTGMVNGDAANNPIDSATKRQIVENYLNAIDFPKQETEDFLLLLDHKQYSFAQVDMIVNHLKNDSGGFDLTSIYDKNKSGVVAIADGMVVGKYYAGYNVAAIDAILAADGD